MPARYTIQSPQGIPGPIGLIHIEADAADDLDSLFRALSSGTVRTGDARLIHLRDGESAVIARWTPLQAHVMPHAGVEVMRSVIRTLQSAGAVPQPAPPCPSESPLAGLSDTLADAASPMAIDLLLDQPRRWAADPRVMVSPAHASMLRHLLTPPLVVAWGPPNIGKSTLLNALAQRDLAIVAPDPGTTRDHVGALLNINGLVVRYADTPGVRPDPHPAEAEAIQIARTLAASADLLLWCRDATSPRPPLPPTRALVLPLDLRSDLGPPAPPPGVSVCARDQGSLNALARAIRHLLVPDAALADPGCWDFRDP